MFKYLDFVQRSGGSIDLPRANQPSSGAVPSGLGANTILAGATVKSNIPSVDQKPIDFTCFIHGRNFMNARLVF